MPRKDLPIDKIRGCLMGVAIGDALGMPVEGLKPFEVAAVNRGSGVRGFMSPVPGREMFGTHELKAGGTTDDWQLTKAVARSLIRTNGRLDLQDCAEEHVRELKARTISWGNTTTSAIQAIADGKRNVLRDTLPPALPKQGCGNGVMMKIAPIAIINAHTSVECLWDDCRALGSLTHADIRASLAAFAIAARIRESLIAEEGAGEPVGFSFLTQLIEDVRDIEKHLGMDEELVSDRLILIDDAIHDHVALRTIPGYMRFHAMYTVTITLGTFLRHPRDFRAGILEVVNAGGDADSNGAIVGAMIGAHVGLQGIPYEWRSFNPAFNDAIDLADKLAELVS